MFVLQNLTIQENAPGLDGQEYRLRCEVLCSLIPKNKSIPALEIPFLFYNGRTPVDDYTFVLMIAHILCQLKTEFLLPRMTFVHHQCKLIYLRIAFLHTEI